MSQIAGYQPSRWQQMYHALPHDEALGAGAAGPGKTLCLLMEPLAQIVTEAQRVTDPKHPYPLGPRMSTGWALHLRRTMPMLEQTIQRSHRIFPQIDSGAAFDNSKHTWTFSSGYKYQFGHCRDLSDWEIYFSGEFSIVLFDELVQFTEEQYEQISGRLRSADPVLSKMLKVRAMSNPFMTRDGMDNVSVSDPMWVRRRFVDPAPEGKTTISNVVTLRSGEKVKRRRIYLPATLYDNPDPEFQRQYEATLMDKPEHIRKAMLFGDWYFTANSFFTDWDAKIHVCEPFDIPNDWPQFRSMDWGYKLPGVVHWWALDEDDNLFCIGEYKFQGRTVAEVAKMILEREATMGLAKHSRSLISGPADTQLWERRYDGHGKTKAKEFSELGVPWVQADKRSRATNALRLAGRLRDHQRKTTTPGLVFFKDCREIIRTIPAVSAQAGKPEEPADFKDDHALDSALYACAYVSRGRNAVPGKSRENDDDDDEIETRQAAGTRGRYGYGSL